MLAEVEGLGQGGVVGGDEAVELGEDAGVGGGVGGLELGAHFWGWNIGKQRRILVL